MFLCCCSVLSRIRLYATPRTAAHQASLSFTVTQSLLKFMSIESVMLSKYLILCHPLLFCLPSFPASGSCPMSQLFISHGQSTGASASASVLPMSIQGWFPLGLTGLISLHFNRSRVFSSTFPKTPILRHSVFFQSNAHTVHNSWKNQSFDSMNLYRQSDVSALWYAV